MTTPTHTQPGLARRILGSPPVRVLLLGFILLLMMGLNSDVMTSYAGEPVKAVQHIIALAIAGFAVYIGHAHFIEQRAVTELGLTGMGRQFGIGLLIGAGLYTACELMLMALGIYRIDGPEPVELSDPGGRDGDQFERVRGTAVSRRLVPLGGDLVRQLGGAGGVIPGVRPDPPGEPASHP
jgi:hypothetical protein